MIFNSWESSKQFLIAVPHLAFILIKVIKISKLISMTQPMIVIGSIMELFSQKVMFTGTHQ